MFNIQFKRIFFLPLSTSLLLLASCSIQKQISQSAQRLVLKDSSLLTAHVGISIYEPAANKYWYNYQGDKYFVPASNVKIPTCYAAMKYLGDSLVGGRILDSNGVAYFNPSGDPTFLNPDFLKQPVLELLKFYNKIIICDDYSNDNFNKYGPGWSWDDYKESYMPERNRFPRLSRICLNASSYNQRNTAGDFPHNLASFCLRCLYEYIEFRARVNSSHPSKIPHQIRLRS